MMRDEKHFKNPETFQPERFIDSNGNFVHDERVIPFGTGKRVCLGQSLAEKEFFLFFAGLVQQFKFENAPGIEPPSYKDINPAALFRTPPTYMCVLKKRN